MDGMSTQPDYSKRDWDYDIFTKLHLTPLEMDRFKEALPEILKRHDMRNELRFIAPSHRGRTSDHILMRLRLVTNISPL